MVAEAKPAAAQCVPAAHCVPVDKKVRGRRASLGHKVLERSDAEAYAHDQKHIGLRHAIYAPLDEGLEGALPEEDDAGSHKAAAFLARAPRHTVPNDLAFDSVVGVGGTASPSRAFRMRGGGPGSSRWRKSPGPGGRTSLSSRTASCLDCKVCVRGQHNGRKKR